MSENSDSDSEISEYSDEESIISSPAKKRKIDTTSFKYKIHDVLKPFCNVGSGKFVLSGELQHAPFVYISIKNGERVKFPLHEDEIGTIIEDFEQCPYGKGTRTIVDTKFRNSWQLDPKKFQVTIPFPLVMRGESGRSIMNPNWNAFIVMLTAHIKKGMAIETSFSANLYKLLMYKTGSFFKPHRDSEKESGMFATLVIQLPSRYIGGQLLVKHDGRTKTIDFSSTTDDKNEFSTFFSVFYCDCEHEILPVTSGVRVCLIYNLVMLKTESTIPSAPCNSINEAKLTTLFKSWKEFNPHKPPLLVYVFSHKYTEMSLGFTNLKTTDKAVADLLNRLSKACSLTVHLGFLEKVSEGRGNEDDGSGTGFADECDVSDTYHMRIEKFKNKMEIDFEEEVIHINHFDRVSYEESREATGNEGCEVTLFYRTAALIIWHNDNILQVLSKAGTDSGTVEGMFLKEYNKNSGKPIADKLMKWSHFIASMSPTCNNYYGYASYQSNNNTVELFTTMVAFNDLKLIQNYLNHHNTITPEIIPLLQSQCNKYGWESLSAQLINMLKHVKNYNTTATLLGLLVGDKPFQNDKEIVCQELAKVVLQINVTKKPDSRFFQSVKTEAEKNKEMEDEQKFLYSMFVICRKLNLLDINEYAKTKVVTVVVPVLLKLASENSNNLLSECDNDVAITFIAKMESLLGAAEIVPNWRSNDFGLGNHCEDCMALKIFLESDSQSQSFKMPLGRRKHLINRIYNMNGISHETMATGSPHTLVITKAQMLLLDNIRVRKSSTDLLPKLKAILHVSM